MSQSKATKDAFEKVRSRLQKREIYLGAVGEARPFMIKISEELHNLIPQSLGENQLRLGPTGPSIPQGPADAMGFFHVGQDRYFFNGPFSHIDNLIVVPLDTDVFKLERRKTLRAVVPADFPVTFLITQINQQSVFIDGCVADISGGGLKIFFPDGLDHGLQPQSQVRGTVRAPNGKTIPFQGEVRHVQMTDPEFPQRKSFGLEMETPQGISQRMMLLTMDVQRRLVMGY